MQNVSLRSSQALFALTTNGGDERAICLQYSEKQEPSIECSRRSLQLASTGQQELSMRKRKNEKTTIVLRIANILMNLLRCSQLEHRLLSKSGTLALDLLVVEPLLLIMRSQDLQET